MLFTGACTTVESPRIVIVTAELPTTASEWISPDAVELWSSPAPDGATVDGPTVTLSLSQVPNGRTIPTPNPSRTYSETWPNIHIIQPGESLSVIAQRYNLSLNSILRVNELENPNVVAVGQVINLPDLPSQFSPSLKLIADSRVVRGPDSAEFDVISFILRQPGYIQDHVEPVETRIANGGVVEDMMTAGEIVQRVSLEYSVDPRLLLAILEYRAQWLSNPEPIPMLLTHPLISEDQSGTVDRAGLYRQLAWAANEINRGYYQSRYGSFIQFELSDGIRVRPASGLNSGTVGLQYFFSLFRGYQTWLADVSEEGLFRTYYAYFGDPFDVKIEPPLPEGITQPELALPFDTQETWFFTGGPHGGWGSGSAWGAIDFAPPDERPPGQSFCYVSSAWVRAVASGVIARSGDGTVILDLDGDGDEGTGWTILYLHIADENRIPVGESVQTGDPIGRPSCAGGFSNATHLHIARRYNGEWLPADCFECVDDSAIPLFVMSGWRVSGLQGQMYQGYLVSGSQRVQAEQGRTSLVNRIGG